MAFKKKKGFVSALKKLCEERELSFYYRTVHLLTEQTFEFHVCSGNIGTVSDHYAVAVGLKCVRLTGTVEYLNNRDKWGARIVD